MARMSTPPRVAKAWPFWVSSALSVIALAASSILLADYLRPSPVFCRPDGGCGVVRQTVWAFPLGIPMPLIGVIGIFSVAIAGLWPGRRAGLVRAALATVGALVALGLLGVQVALGSVCPYCVVVDVSVVVLGALALAAAVGGWDPPASKQRRGLALTAFALATAVPLVIGALRKPMLPAVIAQEMGKAPRGRVTVVDFVDFQCPFCRATHEALAPILAERRGQLHVVRKHVPLPNHRFAWHAARAACCAEQQGKSDELAEALFSATFDELSPEGCERMAASLGLDTGRFRACVSDAATDARIRADIQAFRAAKGRGLPTLWIGDKVLEGAQQPEALRAALDEAIRAL